MSSSGYAIDIPSAHDVLCGVGVSHINHTGNTYYRSYVHSLQIEYKQTKQHTVKRGIVKKIFEHLTISRRGHFLHHVGGLWREVSQDKALTTIRNCIGREMTIPNKSIRVVVPVSSAYRAMSAPAIKQQQSIFKSHHSGGRYNLRSTRMEIPNKNNAPQSDDTTQCKTKKMHSSNKQSSSALGSSSYIDEKFLANNPHLNPHIWEVLDSIYTHGSFRGEDMVNDLGIVLSGDSVRGNDATINVERKSYQRRNFGRPVLFPQTDNPKTELRSTCGTGSGTRTHGTPQGQLCFGRFTRAMDFIATTIQEQVKVDLASDKSICDAFHFHNLNTMVAIAYYDKMEIQDHRDQRYDNKGKFMDSQNCQLRDSPTCILAIGDTRMLQMHLRRHKTELDNNRGLVPIDHPNATKQIQLKHGTLFVLHPDDEKTIIRECFDTDYKTFWQHGSSGVFKEKMGMSLGLVFRISIHTREVHLSTGQLVLTPEQQKKDKEQHPTCYAVLDAFVSESNAEKKKQIEAHIQSRYSSMKARFNRE